MNIAELLAEGMRHQANGDLDRAARCYSQALAADPGNGQARSLLERCQRVPTTSGARPVLGASSPFQFLPAGAPVGAPAAKSPRSSPDNSIPVPAAARAPEPRLKGLDPSAAVPQHSDARLPRMLQAEALAAAQPPPPLVVGNLSPDLASGSEIGLVPINDSSASARLNQSGTTQALQATLAQREEELAALRSQNEDLLASMKLERARQLAQQQAQKSLETDRHAELDGLSTRLTREFEAREKELQARAAKTSDAHQEAIELLHQAHVRATAAESQLAESQQRLAALEAQLASSGQQSSQGQARVRELEEQVRALRALERALQESQATVEKQQAKAGRHQQDLAQAQQALARSEAHATDVQEQLEALVEKLAHLHADVGNKDAALKALEGEVAHGKRIEASLRASEQRVTDLQGQLEAYAATAQGLETRVAELDGLRSANANERDERTQYVRSLEGRLQDTGRRLESQREEGQARQARVAQLEAAARATEEKAAQDARRRDALEEQVLAAGQRVQALEAELATQAETLGQQVDQLDELRAQSDLDNRELLVRAEALTAQKRELDESQRREKALNAQLADVERLAAKEQTSLERRLEDSQQQRKVLTDQLKELRGQALVDANELQTRADLLKVSESTVDKTTRDLAAARARAAELELAQEHTAKEMGAIRARHDDAQKKLEASTSREQQLTARVKEWESKANDANHALDGLQERMDQRVGELETRLEARGGELDGMKAGARLAQEELKEARSQAQDLDARCAGLMLEISELKLDHQKALDVAASRVAGVERQLQEEKDQHAQARQQARDHDERATGLLKELNQLKLDRQKAESALEKRVDGLERQLREETEELTEVRSQAHEQDGRSMELLQELNQLKLERQKAESALQSRVASLEEQVHEGKEELAEARGQARQHDERSTGLLKELNQLKLERQKAEAALESRAGTLEKQLLEEQAAHAKENVRLAQELKEAQAELSREQRLGSQSESEFVEHVKGLEARLAKEKRQREKDSEEQAARVQKMERELSVTTQAHEQALGQLKRLEAQVAGGRKDNAPPADEGMAARLAAAEQTARDATMLQERLESALEGAGADAGLAFERERALQEKVDALEAALSATAYPVVHDATLPGAPPGSSDASKRLPRRKGSSRP